MCCWFASSFGWFLVSWVSTCLRASTTTVSMRHQRNTLMLTWSTTRPSVRHSLKWTLLRSGGRTSRSTLTMWEPDTSPCCKWWAHRSSSRLLIPFLVSHLCSFAIFQCTWIFFAFFFFMSFTPRSVVPLNSICFLHSQHCNNIYSSYSLCILVCFFMHLYSYTCFFPCTSCTTGHASVSVWVFFKDCNGFSLQLSLFCFISLYECMNIIVCLF